MTVRELFLKRGKALPVGGFVNAFLSEAGSDAMNVDGSVTPVIFNYSNTPEEVIVGKIIFYIEGNMVFSSVNFAGLTALPNGVLIECAGIQLANWKDNVDIISSAPIIGGAAEVFGIGTKGINGTWSLDETIKAIGGLYLPPGETLAVKIRDDLSNLNVFRMCVQGVKIS